MTTILLIILLAVQIILDIKIPVYIWVITGVSIFLDLIKYIVMVYQGEKINNVTTNIVNEEVKK